MNALEREHKKYEHVSYRPVAVAADEDTNTAFVGVAWEYKNIGKHHARELIIHQAGVVFAWLSFVDMWSV